MTPVLEVADLRVEFRTDEGRVPAVRGVSFQLSRGEVLGIVGESGSGKSVTSLAMMGLLTGSSQVAGSVRLGDTELLGASDKELSRVRGQSIAMIFQDPMTSLNPVYPIGYQIVEAIRAHHDITRDAARSQAQRLLGVVSIPNPSERMNNYPHELSGGMRQRVVIAIAMANGPEVIIADEPTTALDVTVQAQILEALHTARVQTGAAMLLITHDLGVIAGQADRVLVMYAGRVVEAGTVEEIFYAPQMPYTLGLLGSQPRLDLRRQRLHPISGAPPSALHLPPGCPFAPRCPLAAPVCEADEPPLVATGTGGHLSACHFSDQLVGVAPGDLFRPISQDTPL
ncbi:MAG: dipeptide/oligopeptide/nickel ABC transporter ATP-binding protein [Pseudonocardiales bacterium]|nr:ABC transporter ATP-binding protein [Actinomycetota bacterium]PZS11866.1 MAG: dipeptide/oligopeptide/nickel ABC transporter ATP-binding protein [Pseudonocardiales bacterium]